MFECRCVTIGEKQVFAEISVNYETEEGDSILSVIIRGSITEVDCGLSEEEKCETIRTEAFPTLYTKLRSFIDLVLKNANIELPNIPPEEKVKL